MTRCDAGDTGAAGAAGAGPRSAGARSGATRCPTASGAPAQRTYSRNRSSSAAVPPRDRSRGFQPDVWTVLYKWPPLDAPTSSSKETCNEKRNNAAKPRYINILRFTHKLTL